jgi:hypothetical protein
MDEKKLIAVAVVCLTITIVAAFAAIVILVVH